MKKKILMPALILTLLMTFLIACQPASPVQTVNQSPEPVGTKSSPITPDHSSENVYINDIRINIMESFPLQVSVTVFGDLPDGCTSIVDSTAKFDNENTFEIHIYTDRPEDLMCTQALVPFEETIPLDVNGLPAGKYTVNVYQLSDTFEFQTDNVIPD
jgi:inhibitor of cysteine peptidase